MLASFLAAAADGKGGNGTLLLGDDLLAYIVLALGGAMVVGPFLAMVRPRDEDRDGDLERAPVGRSVAFMIVGLVGTIWAIATLTTG